ncbi:hypothetical protein ACIGO9_29915 [Nocardia asteroides]|uniref:hypothetical protein n=1 Tax=Nocardia asteroides TaxID=1824 RepID=UPI0037C65A8C
MTDARDTRAQFTPAMVRRTAVAQLARLDAYHDLGERVLAELTADTHRRPLARGGRGSAAGLVLAATVEGVRPEVIQRHLSIIAETTGVWAQWQRHRAVYAVDPELALDLLDTGPEAYRAADLTRVPHDNPLLLLSQPIAVDDIGFGFCEPSHVFAIGVTGYDHASDRYCGFSDPARTHVQWSIHVILPSGHDNTETVHQMTPPLPDPAAVRVIDAELLARQREAVAPALALAQAALAYLCAEPDIVSANTIHRPTRTAAAGASKQRSKAANLFGVGYRVGPTLPGKRRERHERVENLGSGASRKPPQAHLRRSHLRTLADGSQVRVRSTRVNAGSDPDHAVIDATVMAVTVRESAAALAAQPARGAGTDPNADTLATPPTLGAAADAAPVSHGPHR